MLLETCNYHHIYTIYTSLTHCNKPTRDQGVGNLEESTTQNVGKCSLNNYYDIQLFNGHFCSDSQRNIC